MTVQVDSSPCRNINKNFVRLTTSCLESNIKRWHIYYFLYYKSKKTFLIELFNSLVQSKWSNVFPNVYLIFSRRKWTGHVLLATGRLSNLFVCLMGVREDKNASADGPLFSFSVKKHWTKAFWDFWDLRSHWYSERHQHLCCLWDRGATQNQEHIKLFGTAFLADLRVVASWRYVVVGLSLENKHIFLFLFYVVGFSELYVIMLSLSSALKKAR